MNQEGKNCDQNVGAFSRSKTSFVVFKFLQLIITATVACWLLPFVWIGCKMYHRPPNMAYLAQLIRFIRYVWTANPTDPTFAPGARIYLTMVILMNYFGSIIAGAAWILDEILFGDQFDQVSIDKPFFLISGGRSGSTQLARYLEQDPNLICPCFVMTICPYLWAWKLAPLTIGRFITKQQVHQKVLEMMPAEGIKRHEVDPFRSDTFDPAFLTTHLNSNALQLGPTIGAVEFNFAEAAPHNKTLIEKDYVDLIDRIGRKTLLYHAASNNGSSRSTIDNNKTNQQPRFFIKGHFLHAAPALVKKYPDCSMLTVLRDPCKRLQSCIHFIRVNPADPFLGPVPWNWLTRTLESGEARYCEVEKDFFSDSSSTSSRSESESEISESDGGVVPKKCVIHFDDFVQNLPHVMTTIYEECFGMDELPPNVPIKHAPKEDRGKYTINRSLAELGVDQESYKRRLAGYIEWMETIKKKNSCT